MTAGGGGHFFRWRIWFLHPIPPPPFPPSFLPSILHYLLSTSSPVMVGLASLGVTVGLSLLPYFHPHVLGLLLNCIRLMLLKYLQSQSEVCSPGRLEPGDKTAEPLLALSKREAPTTVCTKGDKPITPHTPYPPPQLPTLSVLRCRAVVTEEEGVWGEGRSAVSVTLPSSDDK